MEDTLSGKEKFEDVVEDLGSDTEDHEKYGHTQRGLKSRHIQLIALGGCIGTGLFVGTGATLSLAGPAPLFMCMSSRVLLRALAANNW